MNRFAGLVAVSMLVYLDSAGNSVGQPRLNVNAIAKECATQNGGRERRKFRARIIARDAYRFRTQPGAVHPIHFTKEFGHKAGLRPLVEFLWCPDLFDNACVHHGEAI